MRATIKLPVDKNKAKLVVNDKDFQIVEKGLSIKNKGMSQGKVIAMVLALGG
jgi:hypothetical protein